jgi:hypothetical protein
MEAVVSTVAGLFRDVHAGLRETVRGLDAEALNWSPTDEETNSLAALVIHTIGSEQEVLRTVRAVAGERDRAAEFRATASDAEELVARLDDADRYLDELAAGITPDDLVAVRPRGTNREPQSGLYWLISNYGHAREHLAHAQLTRQLYEARSR